MAELDSGQGKRSATADKLFEDLGIQRFDSVWDALEETPQDAQLMRLRSTLLQEITQRVARWECLDVVAAHRLGVALPELECLREGKIHHFSLEELLAICNRAGLNVELTVTEA
ncbi:XRE family transcriptional regulator [Billgrantia sulfidoxydans]|uniref:XRE family transcriptional regulator n=2 Tax=Billgrantia sulfidoxydans TaxID=2733484 RepID=A0ABX7W9M4_9GAMM|nr:XRE family transcriptional regulator [Halomonas sulfidoxydans]